MTKVRLKQIASAVRSALDRKTMGGVFVGIAIMASAMATAETSETGGGWFAGLFTTGGAGGNSTTTLLSQQDSVVATAITKEATDCANGAPGTIGEAIKTAMNVHSELASATPNVESLFDVNSDCFSSIGQIFDLSFAIPSLGSILAAAQNAVLKYAQKKVCTAINKVTSTVTSPINQAITKINTLQGLTNINGMANSAIGGALSGIDPNLGGEYHATSPGGTYTTNTNPFGSSQTTFDSSTSGGSSTNTQLNNNTAQINSLTNQVANQQIKINQDQVAVENAQSAYSSCSGGWDTDCSSSFAALQAAQKQLASSQSTLISLQTQLSQFVTQNGGISQASAAQSAPVSTTSSGSSSSWWSSVSNVLN